MWPLFVPFSIEMDQANSERLMTAILRPKLARFPGDYNTTFVKMSYPAIYQISCVMNVRYFPWDQHTCSLEFTSWTFDKTDLDYKTANDSVSTKSYIVNQVL